MPVASLPFAAGVFAFQGAFENTLGSVIVRFVLSVLPCRGCQPRSLDLYYVTVWSYHKTHTFLDWI
jgi:hypothetical protein